MSTAPDDVWPVIPARELQRGDYISSPRERGGHVSGTRYVQRVTREAGTVFVTVSSGVYDITLEYPENDTVTIHPR